MEEHSSVDTAELLGSNDGRKVLSTGHIFLLFFFKDLFMGFLAFIWIGQWSIFRQEVRRSEEVGRGSGSDSRPESNLCPRRHCSP